MRESDAEGPTDPRVGADMLCAWVDGVLTPYGKLQAHRKGLKHKAVSVFVVDGTQVLMQKRASTKYHTPGLWTNTCCTHPRWGEASDSCAVRRLNEEVGLRNVQPEFRHSLEYRAAVGNGLIEHEVVDVFVSEGSAEMNIEPNPDEVSATEWVELDDLSADIRARPDRFTPWFRIYMSQHRERIFPM